MSIRSNKARADRLAEEVMAVRRARRAHSARAKAIFLRRLGSPGGLAACFGAGAVAGLRLGESESDESAGRDGDRRAGGAQGSRLERFADSPVGNIAVRLAAATLVQYLLTSASDGTGGEAAGEPAPDVSAAGGH